MIAAAGWLASSLVFAAFFMRAMLRLRLVAIASNAAFITYAALCHLAPVFTLHVCLLLLNAWRLRQLRRRPAAVPRGLPAVTRYDFDTANGGWRTR